MTVSSTEDPTMFISNESAKTPENSTQELFPANPTPTVSVVIPALNEEESLPHVLAKIPDWVHEVLLVDGNSTDATIEVASNLREDIRIVPQEGFGKGAALRTGIETATGDIVVTLDADGSTNPEEIPAFVGVLLAGADFAKGTRFVQGAGTADMPFYRRMGNLALVVLTNILFGTQYTDITYGYNALWRRHAQALALEIDGWAHEIINNIRAVRNGLRVVEVASFEHERIAGEAKLSAFSAGWTILKAILQEPFKQLVRESRTFNLGKSPQSQPRTRVRVYGDIQQS